MKELVPALEELGLEDVVTYIQSGNVVFRGPAGKAKLVAQLERAIEQRFGLDVTVMLRTPAELEKLIAANPFGGDEAKLHVAFLDRKPAQAAVAKLDPDRSPPDEFAVARHRGLPPLPERLRQARSSAPTTSSACSASARPRATGARPRSCSS